MSNPLRKPSWSPYIVGASIGVLSWFAFVSADHPIGITTAFENVAAVSAKAVVPQLEQSSDFYTDRTAEGKPPKIGWEAMLVIGAFIGALSSSLLSGDRTDAKLPKLWRWRFGSSVAKRFTVVFFAAALMMFGARLAGGCTSGHGISGSLQMAVSSWVFAVVIFTAGIVTAFAMFGKRGADHV